jgi:hypothetical protein
LYIFRNFLSKKIALAGGGTYSPSALHRFVTIFTGTYRMQQKKQLQALAKKGKVGRTEYISK